MELHIPFSAISFFIALSFFIFMLMKKPKSFKKKNTTQKLPPGPLKLPIIGNIHQLVGSTQHRGLRDLAKKHGPLMYLKLGEVSAVVASSPEMAKEILKTHDISFANRPEILVSRVMLRNGKDMVFSPYGDYWRQMRKICTVELLTANKVASFRSIREEEALNLVESIRSSLGSPINLTKTFSSWTNSITCRAAIGKRCKYQDALISIIEDMASLAGGFDISDVFPSIKPLHVLSGAKPKLQKMRKKQDEIFDGVIGEHKENRDKIKRDGSSVGGEEDLVDVLLRLQEKGGLQYPLNYDDIQGIIMDMLIAGTDTSSAALDWAMSELIRNPRVMKKAQAEVRQTLKGKAIIHEADIQELSYLTLVVKETLRLYPPVTLLLPRENREEREICGYTIPVKTKVIVNAWAINRDPKFWVDAESFIPERFENLSVDFMGTNLNYLPFGAGRRMCPGISFGLASVEYPLALLLYHFDWKLPSVMRPGDLNMDEVLGATLKRKNNLFLSATLCPPSNEYLVEHAAMKV